MRVKVQSSVLTPGGILQGLIGKQAIIDHPGARNDARSLLPASRNKHEKHHPTSLDAVTVSGMETRKDVELLSTKYAYSTADRLDTE